MKNKTIKKIVAGLFASVMVITVAPQTASLTGTAITAEAKTQFPFNSKKLYYDTTELWGDAISSYYGDIVIDRNGGFRFNGSYGSSGMGSCDTVEKGSFYDIKKSGQKYTMKMKVRSAKTNSFFVVSQTESVSHKSIFKKDTKCTLYCPGYSVKKLPKTVRYHANQKNFVRDDMGINGKITSWNDNILKDNKGKNYLKGYILVIDGTRKNNPTTNTDDVVLFWREFKL